MLILSHNFHLHPTRPFIKPNDNNEYTITYKKIKSKKKNKKTANGKSYEIITIKDAKLDTDDTFVYLPENWFDKIELPTKEYFYENQKYTIDRNDYVNEFCLTTRKPNTTKNDLVEPDYSVRSTYFSISNNNYPHTNKDLFFSSSQTKPNSFLYSVFDPQNQLSENELKNIEKSFTEKSTILFAQFKSGDIYKDTYIKKLTRLITDTHKKIEKLTSQNNQNVDAIYPEFSFKTFRNLLNVAINMIKLDYKNFKVPTTLKSDETIRDFFKNDPLNANHEPETVADFLLNYIFNNLKEKPLNMPDVKQLASTIRDNS